MSKLIALVGKVPEVAVKQGAPRFATFLKYARVELKPPTPGEFGEIAKGFRNLMSSPARLKNTTIKQAWLNTLVAIEISMWFFVGECIGKRRLIGYYVKP